MSWVSRSRLLLKRLRSFCHSPESSCFGELRRHLDVGLLADRIVVEGDEVGSEGGQIRQVLRRTTDAVFEIRVAIRGEERDFVLDDAATQREIH